MKVADINQISIGEIVALDHRAASVFKEAGIDFCCGGKKTLSEACSEKNIKTSEIISKLDKLESTPNTSHNFIDWDPGFLCDYIVNTHHKYVLKTLPELMFYTRKIAGVHGEHHPELIEVAELFSKVNNELLQHLGKEEAVLFPAIKAVLKDGSVNSKDTVKSEISRLEGEHEFAGGAIDRISVITNRYQLPADACNSYRVTFKMLEEFEDDLHIHVHLENNILFPKVLELSK